MKVVSDDENALIMDAYNMQDCNTCYDNSRRR